MDNNNELFPIVDEDGKVMGSATRGECHSGSHLLHPVVHLHVFNSNGDIYLQRRPDWKDIQPGKWDTAVGGHVNYGETPDEALHREVLEELGITDYHSEFICSYVFDSDRERELVYVHCTIYDGEIWPSAEELNGGRFWTMQQIQEAMGKNVLTPNFESEFKRCFANKLYNTNNMEKKVKALFINGSPRKKGNTAQLLQRAMEGAREAGAEVEMVNLYDRNLNFKGCMSCFACKLKGGRKGVCSFKDDLLPILEKAVNTDVLVCGSPNYCGYPSAMLRAFMERMEFPAVNYSDYSRPVVNKRIHSATIYTMNCPNEEVYRMMNYHVLMDTSAQQLAVFGPTELLLSYDTYQFNNYDRYDAAAFSEPHKADIREKQFPLDLERAFELGKRLVTESSSQSKSE